MTSATVSAPVATPARRRRGRRRSLTAWLFLLPAAAFVLALTIAPFFQAILMSFQEWDGISMETPWVGLENYAAVMSDSEFWGSMRNVVTFGLAGFFLGNGIAISMALAVNAAPRARAFFRTAFYLPSVFSVVVVGLIFRWLLEPRVGVINTLLESLGLGALAHNWLGDPATAVPAVALTFVWYHWGFAFILFLAGLQDVPKELHEAASLDGALAWGRFRYVTWPHLAPVTSIVSLLTLVAALQIFGTVQVLTNGGPGSHTMVPTLRIYNEAFSSFRYGTAAAMSVLFGGALMALAIFQLWITSRRSGR
ncbi:carbohydrate ABC transporter permease [Brachybacterium sp. YJGR34]|uniref:carbohydrate ABC transporter permease n=1 Tax=Brachybacterium sp. YJGR34 TaxID=2059911 RepID=UPI000E0A7EDF|nr:sugar ABC transporter permease [Brachybacterium sp. YJGR34]